MNHGFRPPCQDDQYDTATPNVYNRHRRRRLVQVNPRPLMEELGIGTMTEP